MYLYRKIEHDEYVFYNDDEEAIIQISEMLTSNNSPLEGKELFKYHNDNDRYDIYYPSYTITKKTPVGYWRNANHIFDWIIYNVYEEENDAQYIDISFDQLITLKNLCKKVIKYPKEADDILPVSDVQLFKEGKYTEVYFDILKDTIGIIENIEKWEENNESLIGRIKNSKNMDDIIPKLEISYQFHASW